MAVKKHKLVQDQQQVNIYKLANYLQLLDEHIHYVSTEELIKNCQEIVKCLARAQGSYADLWESLQLIEDFLVHVMVTISEDARNEVITAVMEKFNQYISDPKTNACAATSAVLVVLNTNSVAAHSAAHWLVQKSDAARLRASLGCLYMWLHQKNGTPTIGAWVLTFLQALEENEHFDLLKEVSVENIGNLFLAMDKPSELRQSSADVVLHVLASLRESIEALDAISPHVDTVLTSLASESGQFSRQLLQNFVDILTEMVNILSTASNDTPTFRNKYSVVICCLERHMESRGCRYLQLPPWRLRSASAHPMNTRKSLRKVESKVGLLNLGNTCYMNSIMQALLLTRQFSTHVMMQMNSVPYWSKMGVLFAKMVHSVTKCLDPVDFFMVFKPPCFTTNNQHDSSEFLGYLFELLQSFEHHSDANFDYKKPPNRGSSPNILQRLRNCTAIPATSAVICEADSSTDPGPNRRSVSPRPGSSGYNNSTWSNKWAVKSEVLPPKKRPRLVDQTANDFNDFKRRVSFIDTMFGGVLLTRVVCTECNSSFVSRDNFRDLQLAFPDNQDDLQHSVQSLLEYYCSEEKLTGDNKYECRACGVLTDAERSVRVETTPKYLILVLKNFKYEPKLQVQTKLLHKMYHNYVITLPTERPQGGGHASYALYAAVVHTGTTLDSGHYYTLAKDHDNWYSYNDDNVTPTNEAEINRLNTGCTPYVLFYRRTDVEEGTAPALADLPARLQEQVMSHNKEIVDNARMQKRLGYRLADK